MQATIYKWLRDRISLDIGQKRSRKDGSIGPLHLNTNDDVLQAFNHNSWWRLDRLTNEMLDAHFSGRETFYFTASGSTKADEVLVMIDIDCHRRGTLAGAIAFAKYLEKKHFANLYFETSTNGNGVHGYILIRKQRTGDVFFKQMLKWLDAHLKSLLAETDFDVELVEIKGQCPVCVWDAKVKGQLCDYTSGVLAKLPRSKDRFDELRNTTVLTSVDLLRLSKSSTPRTPSSAKRVLVQVGGSSNQHTQFSDVELAEVQGHYYRVADSLMNSHSMSTSGRSKVIVEDVAIFLMMLRAFTNNLYSDGSMPTKRFSETWHQLVQEGRLGRSFDCKRFASIRNYLSSLGLIEWTDENYTVGWTDDKGGYHKGKAAKWKASAELMAQLELPQEAEALADHGGGEREHIVGTPLSQFVQSLVRLSDSETVRPEERLSTPIWRADPDHVTSFVTPFELHLAA